MVVAGSPSAIDLVARVTVLASLLGVAIVAAIQLIGSPSP